MRKVPRKRAHANKQTNCAESKDHKLPVDTSELDVGQIKLMTDDEFKDITFITRDAKKVRAHKFMLMARSKYLHTMFTR